MLFYFLSLSVRVYLFVSRNIGSFSTSSGMCVLLPARNAMKHRFFLSAAVNPVKGFELLRGVDARNAARLLCVLWNTLLCHLCF